MPAGSGTFATLGGRACAIGQRCPRDPATATGDGHPGMPRRRRRLWHPDASKPAAPCRAPDAGGPVAGGPVAGHGQRWKDDPARPAARMPPSASARSAHVRCRNGVPACLRSSLTGLANGSRAIDPVHLRWRTTRSPERRLAVEACACTAAPARTPGAPVRARMRTDAHCDEHASRSAASPSDCVLFRRPHPCAVAIRHGPVQVGGAGRRTARRYPVNRGERRWPGTTAPRDGTGNRRSHGPLGSSQDKHATWQRKRVDRPPRLSTDHIHLPYLT